MAIEARKNVRIYSYERHRCPGCALACFRLWLRQWLDIKDLEEPVGTESDDSLELDLESL